MNSRRQFENKTTGDDSGKNGKQKNDQQTKIFAKNN
jgi:hypothetical protein